jgi:GAF domain-containing protein
MAKTTPGSSDQIKRLRKEVAALKRAAKKHAEALQQSEQAQADAEARATESVEQQTATSDILRVISQLQTDVQPVFDAILASAVRLLGGYSGAVTRIAGDRIELAALTSTDAAGDASLRAQFPLSLHSGAPHAQVIRDRTPLNIADAHADPRVPDTVHVIARARGYHSLVAVPLLRHEKAIGAISVTRREPGGFTGREITLLKTFADQAVIAIENVRLFTELQTSNRELTTALDQRTATSDILRVISQSQTDVQPVFDAIMSSAVRLLEGYSGALTRVAGDQIELAAHKSTDEAAAGALRALFPRSLQSGGPAAQTVRDRAPVNIADQQTDPQVPEPVRALARVSGHRSVVWVPLLRHDEAVGGIGVTRREPGGFTDDEITLLETFADQAVIAIENVRLFTELEGRNRDLTATAEILRVISSSPADTQPVFEAIVNSTQRLMAGKSTVLLLRRDPQFVVGAYAGPAIADLPDQVRAAPLDREQNFPSRAILDAEIVHVPDWEADDVPEHERVVGRSFGIRAGLMVPLLREGQGIGALVVTRSTPGPYDEKEIALLRSFADQAVIAIENARLFSELQASNRDLTTALDQQTATSDVLRVISQSQTDVRPVFDAILTSAVRLLAGYSGTVTRIAGDQIELAALTSTDAAGDASLRALFPQPLHSEAPHAQVIRGRVPVNIADAQGDPRVPEAMRAVARARDRRSWVIVPLLRHDAAVGTISVTRREAGGFTGEEIALLKTFADQAVIAIENVRLFTELEGRNRDLTATSEILRVISSSPTDVQPVFDTIVRSAVRLCDGLHGTAVRFDGEMMHLAAGFNYTPEVRQALEAAFPMRPDRRMMSGRAILNRTVIQVEDALEDPEYAQDVARAGGFRSMLAVPMMHEGNPIGAIVVNRGQPGSFSVSQIELLKTFADQAVIAVENVRLFTELQASNRELTTALDQQTATSDILRVISQSQTDVQPVFDAIVASAVRLLGGHMGALTRVSGDQIELAALTSTDAAGDASLRTLFPQPLHSEAPHAQVIRDRAPLNVADSLTDPRVPEAVRASARARGYRGWVAVPLLRPDGAVGTIAVTRPEAGGFTDEEIALLKTFADQAVIAIENVRLFTELEGRNRDLTATAEILRVISSSPTDVQPVFDTIADAATSLCAAQNAGVFLFDGTLIHFAAHHNWTAKDLEAIRESFPRPPGPGTVTARAILTRAVAHTADISTDPGYEIRGFVDEGFRAILSVPMLRDGDPIGAISVTRREAVPFTDKQIALLQTFADQAVIAIENVRLFKELQTRTTELTRSVGQLTALGEISQAVSSTLDVETVLQTVVSRASQLAGADGCAIYEYDDATEAFHIRATHNLDPALVGTLRASPLRKGEGAIGRAAETREPTQVADIAVAGAYQSHIRETLLGAGYRALLSVPLLREGKVIGSLSLNRRSPGEFPPEAVEVLKTFATQSALAIQNARLFREIADKSAQLEAASRHKSEFLANMSHELRTPLNAIIGFSEVLNERMFGELNDKQAEYLKDIHASGQHLLSLINDILDLSKIEAGRMELELARFDLPQAIDNALTLVRERAGRRGIALHQAVDEGLGQVTGDERKIKQVLLNLLSNALKFTPEGGRIDVGARMADGMAEISVTDTGVGIAPAHHDAVFEEFRQVGEAEKKAEGTGLGLALCRKFVELHGGRIWVKSQIGAGSTFAFTLPLDSSP